MGGHGQHVSCGHDHAHQHQHHEHDHATHDHGHEHSHHHHHHHGNGLTWALLLTLAFACIEAAGGWWSGSLALLSDAGHMFSDVAALGLAAFAQWVARRPPSASHSYGLGRAEVVAALLNGLLMLAVIVWIVVEAVQRLQAYFGCLPNWQANDFQRAILNFGNRFVAAAGFHFYT